MFAAGFWRKAFIRLRTFPSIILYYCSQLFAAFFYQAYLHGAPHIGQSTEPLYWHQTWPMNYERRWHMPTSKLTLGAVTWCFYWFFPSATVSPHPRQGLLLQPGSCSDDYGEQKHSQPTANMQHVQEINVCYHKPLTFWSYCYSIM